MMVRSLYEITECPQCASQNIIHNAKSMQIICKDCGLIYDPLKPFKNVGIAVTSSENNKERIIRPVQKAPSRKPVAKKQIQPIPRHPAVKKPMKKAASKKQGIIRKIPKKPQQKSKKSISAKVKGFMNKFIKRR